MVVSEPGFRRDGFAVVDRILDRSEQAALRTVLDALPRDAASRGGLRGLMSKSAAIRRLAGVGALPGLARSVLGPDARPVKATLFEKSESANWQVPLHQDLTIAVERRIETEGFGPWSIKDGVVHVQPPALVLEKMVAIRVHLDDTDEANGALRVVPGSHRSGRLTPEAVREVRTRCGEVLCPVPAGGAMVMAPLLLHASSKTHPGRRRRVVHVEYSAVDLPGDLAWATEHWAERSPPTRGAG